LAAPDSTTPPRRVDGGRQIIAGIRGRARAHHFAQAICWCAPFSNAIVAKSAFADTFNAFVTIRGHHRDHLSK